MMEGKYPNYFDVVDVIDRALLPKSQQDYTEMTVENIINKFNEEIQKSGFYFKEESLLSARKTIEYYFANVYGRKSNFLGGRSKDIDQNNYFIQNQLSIAKSLIIKNLTNSEGLISAEYTGIIDAKELGSLEELRQRMTRENIEEYVRSVMTCSWEERDTIRSDANALTNDILLHFGIKTNDHFDRDSQEFKRLKSMIISFTDSSRTYYGPRSKEGYYQRSETKQEDYEKFIEDTIRQMTDYIHSVLKDSLDKTEELEERRKREMSPVIEISPTVEISNGVQTTEPEKTVENLESTIEKFNMAQEIISENIALASRLAALEKNIEEIKAQIARNNAKIQNALK